MKSIMLAIQPQWVSKILSGEKTIEVRKTAPKETPFKAYIYCTKGKKGVIFKSRATNEIRLGFERDNSKEVIDILNKSGRQTLNGKVVAEFICDKVDEILPCAEHNGIHYPVESNQELAEIVKKACLTLRELYDYGVKKVDGCYSSTSKLPKLYAYHISDLKIYDQPKELSEFFNYNECKYYYGGQSGCEEYCGKYENNDCINGKTRLKRAPQGWQFVQELK